MTKHTARLSRIRSLRAALLAAGAVALLALLTLASCSSGLKALSDSVQYVAKGGSGIAPPWAMLGMNKLAQRRTIHKGPVTSVLRWQYGTGRNGVRCNPAVGSDGTIYFGTSNYLGNGGKHMPGKIHALTSAGKLKWSYTVAAAVGVSAPAIASDGTIYIGGYSDWGFTDRNMYAMNPNGTLKWKFTADGDIYSSSNIGDDGTIYFGCRSGKLYALNPNGSLKWSYTTGGRAGASPAITTDGGIVFGTGDNTDPSYSLNKIYMFNADGTVRWSHATGEYVPLFRSPSIAADGTIYYAATRYVPYLNGMEPTYAKMFAFSPAGELIWEFDLGGTTGGYPSPSIAIDGTIYCSVGQRNFDNGQRDPSFPLGGMHAINPDGSPKWFFETDFALGNTPAIDGDGRLYFGGQFTYFCLNADGTERWRYAAPYNIGSQASSIGADGTVYQGMAGLSGNGNTNSGLLAFGPGTP